MALATLGGTLLRVGNRLALSIACCCNRLFCRQVREDECGNAVYDCVSEQAESIGPCTESCRPPEDPCECGPTLPCDVCYECIDRKCERIEDCCADGSPCPECQKCVNGVCVPCGECEKCVEGVCVPCGPCEKCEGGECVPCDSDEVCIGGVCVPKQYYCCWNSAADKELQNNNTTCKAATVSGSGQSNPCGTEGSGSQAADLTKSGPHTGLTQCQENCQRYACQPDACGNNSCVPNASGPYGTRAACLAGCSTDPCSGACTFSGASGPGTYSIDGCEREICVSYSSLTREPIRVQIWGPIMADGCPVPGSRVIKADSDWRGDEDCDCPDARGGGGLEGGPTGQITWNKPRGATSFEVVVLHCPDPDYVLDIKCDADCDDLDEGEECAHWCQLQGVDDDIRCVRPADEDRAAIKRNGVLRNLGPHPQPCREPGGTCFECGGFSWICWDGEVPEEWAPFVNSCADEAAEYVPRIEDYLTTEYGCEFEIVEKKRAGRGGLESYPDDVINIAWIGCCKQEDAPP